MDINLLANGIKGLEVYADDKKIEPIKETDLSHKKENLKKDDELRKKELQKSVSKLNKLLNKEHARAEYKVHDKFGDIMVKIVNTDTKEVLLEVPPKKILDLVAKLCELAGVVFDKKA